MYNWLNIAPAVGRGYVGYGWMNVLDSKGCYFVTRSKTNMKYTVIKTRGSEVLKEKGILKDQEIERDGIGTQISLTP